MRKQSKKNTKEWIELTLCNMLDEIMLSLRKHGNKDEVMKILKKYSAEIYNSQNYNKK